MVQENKATVMGILLGEHKLDLAEFAGILSQKVVPEGAVLLGQLSDPLKNLLVFLTQVSKQCMELGAVINKKGEEHERLHLENNDQLSRGDCIQHHKEISDLSDKLQRLENHEEQIRKTLWFLIREDLGQVQTEGAYTIGPDFQVFFRKEEKADAMRALELLLEDMPDGIQRILREILK